MSTLQIAAVIGIVLLGYAFLAQFFRANRLEKELKQLREKK